MYIHGGWRYSPGRCVCGQELSGWDSEKPGKLLCGPKCQGRRELNTGAIFAPVGMIFDAIIPSSAPPVAGDNRNDLPLLNGAEEDF